MRPAEPEVDLKSVMTHVRSVVASLYREESPDALLAEGIDDLLDAAPLPRPSRPGRR